MFEMRNFNQSWKKDNIFLSLKKVTSGQPIFGSKRRTFTLLGEDTDLPTQYVPVLPFCGGRPEGFLACIAKQLLEYVRNILKEMGMGW